MIGNFPKKFHTKKGKKRSKRWFAPLTLFFGEGEKNKGGFPTLLSKISKNLQSNGKSFILTVKVRDDKIIT